MVENGNKDSSQGCGADHSGSRDEQAVGATAPLTPQDGYLIVKRGLYYRPNAMGYTGLRDKAGRYSLAEALDHADPISGVSYVHESDAGELSPNCSAEVAHEHLAGKLAASEKAHASFKAAIERVATRLNRRADQLNEIGDHGADEANWAASLLRSALKEAAFPALHQEDASHG